MYAGENKRLLGHWSSYYRASQAEAKIKQLKDPSYCVNIAFDRCRSFNFLQLGMACALW